MATMLIANNCTRESGSFCGDQLCSLKVAYLFVQQQPDVDKVIMSMSPGNEMAFLWSKFLDDPRGDGSVPPVEVLYDDWNPGDWDSRHVAWNRWRKDRQINGTPFEHYRELYLRIHGAMRQKALCGSERGLGRRNIFQYWFCGQEHCPDELPEEVDWFDDTLIYHPPHKPTRDVYLSPHAKTQGNVTFTFDYWSRVVHKLIDAGVTVTVGYNGHFCEDLNGHPLYRKYWGDHRQWMEEVCTHKLATCGNTGTGWLASACGVPLLTMEPPNSQMPDHRYRQCGLKGIIEILDTPDADYCARRIIEEVQRVVVMTTGCYDILHAGHVRHLEKSKALGTKLVVALNSDVSIRLLKGEIEGVPRPINPEKQRKAVLEALRCVHEVRLFDGPDAVDLIREVKPNVLTNGFGYKPQDIVGRDVVEEYGGRAVVTCAEDAKDEPSTTKIVRKLVRVGDVIEVCRAAMNASVNPFEKLKWLAEEFLSVKDLEGDVADLGACRGGTSLVLHRLGPEKVLYVFDTWAGNPYDDEFCHHKKGEWVASLEECQDTVGRGDNVKYVQGVFPYSAEDLGDPRFCFVYVDADTYQATKDAIAFFWPRLMFSGKMMFDDCPGWLPCAGVEKAVREVFTDAQMKVMGHTCLVEKGAER